MFGGVIADRSGAGPAGAHILEVDTAHKLAHQGQGYRVDFKNPGLCSTLSPALRIATELRNNVSALVAALLESGALSRTGLRYRSIVAALMARSSSRTVAL